jgi:AraC-like DNA-binding protein
MCHLSPVFYGRQFRSGFTVLPRHRHGDSYLALVLSGGYEEAGDGGRHRVRAGHVVLHGAFEAHVNRYDAEGSEVLDLALPSWMEPSTALMQAPDPDTAVRLAERDPKEALAFLLETMKPMNSRPLDWPDELALAIARDPHLRLQDWARKRQLADATISRGFRQVFGVPPSAYRAELKGRLAWRQTASGSEDLSSIAARAGFCDQAHMTHAVRAITGRTPGAWRRDVK